MNNNIITLLVFITTVMDVLNVVGAILAMYLSYSTFHSILWACLAGRCGWFYVTYYVIEYGLDMVK